MPIAVGPPYSAWCAVSASGDASYSFLKHAASLPVNSMSSVVSLKEVTLDNWIACAKLTVHDHQQGYVASNVATIAESKFEPHHVLRAIYNGEHLVGMLAYCHEDDPEDLELFWVFRLLIDKDHQRQGCAAKALRLALEEIWLRGASRVRTMHKPSNTAAAELYNSLGFQPIGYLDDGDVLLETSLGET